MPTNPWIAAHSLAPATHVAGRLDPTTGRSAFGEPASETEARIVALHDHIMLIGMRHRAAGRRAPGSCALFRFRASPPSCCRRHVTRLPWLEFGWTVLPVAALGVIAVPSLQLLRYEADIPPPTSRVKVTAHQWFWRYDYPDHDGFAFDFADAPPERVEAGPAAAPRGRQPGRGPDRAACEFWSRPATSSIPSSCRRSACRCTRSPADLNETWVKIDRPGVYYGQCNQICGLDHSFMPIAIEARAAGRLRGLARLDQPARRGARLSDSGA